MAVTIKVEYASNDYTSVRKYSREEFYEPDATWWQRYNTEVSASDAYSVNYSHWPANGTLSAWAQTYHNAAEYIDAFGPISNWVSVRPVKYFELKGSYNTPGFYKRNWKLVQVLVKRKYPYKEPKKPVFSVRRRKPIKVPKLVLAEMRDQWTPPSRPYNELRWQRKLSYLLTKERERVETVNRRRRASYEARMVQYHKNVALRKSRDQAALQRYLVRLEKYKVRMTKWREQHIQYKAKYRYVKVRQRPVLESLPYWYYFVEFKNPEAMSYKKHSSEVIPYSFWYYSPWNSPTGSYRIRKVERHYPFYFGGNEFQGGFDMGSFFLDDLESNILGDQEAIENRILKKIQDGKVEIGNIIAERAQTYKLLKTACEDLLSFVKAYKRPFSLALSKRKQNLGKTISNRYLEFQFGVKPLVNDIVELSKFDFDADPVVKAKTGKHWKGSFSTPSANYTGVYKVNYTAKYTLDDGLHRVLSQLGLVDPVSIAWEIMPWSFVVDWLLPVGDAIASLSARNGLAFVSFDRVESFSGEVTMRPDFDGYSSDATGEPSSYNVVLKRRSQLPQPFGTVVPTLKNPFSFRHGLLSLALLYQRLK